MCILAVWEVALLGLFEGRSRLASQCLKARSE
jgi:hypothetical protein